MSNDDPHVSTTTAKVFISYRRDDSAGHAGRLYDQINNYFGDAIKVFMDVDAIGPGEDFVNVIENAVGECEILIAVIGRDWLTITDEGGKRRLDNPEDFIRIEIAAALNRNVRVIPVLVQDAEMPRRDQLPEALAGLSRRNAIELSDERWKFDVDRLIKVIDQLVGPRPVHPPLKEVPPPPPPWFKPWQVAALAAALVVAAGLGIWLLMPLLNNRNKNTNSGNSNPSPVNSDNRGGPGDPVTNRGPLASPNPTHSPTPEVVRVAIQVVRVNLRGGFSRGFFTSQGYIVAMVGQMLKTNDTTTVTWTEAGQEHKEVVDVVGYNDWIALLKLKSGLIGREVRIRNANSLRVGEDVERFIDRNDRTPGKVVQLNAKGMKAGVLLTTKISFAGEAGSPVIDSRGRIVAMVLGGRPDQTESMPIETIKVFFPHAF